MPGFESFDTDHLPPEQRLEYWNELACNTFTPIVADATDVLTFAPTLTRTRAGPLRMGTVCSSPSTVHHAREHVLRTREALFFLQIQVAGESWNLQDGREAQLRAGDFTVFDATRPYRMFFDAPNTVLVVGIPDTLLRRHLTHPEGVVAIRMGYDDNLNRVLADFALGFWRQCRIESASIAAPFTNALLNLLASAYATLAQPCDAAAARRESLRIRIVHHIENHLSERALSPQTIAAMLQTSARYVHSIFTRGEETVARYILRRRLEESARLLATASHRARTVSGIASEHGFGSSTNFGKAFRQRYGVTPTEYRREHLGSPRG